MNRILGALLILTTAPAAFAHELRPAYLELTQTSPRIYDVSWKVPARDDGSRLALYVRLPEGTREVAAARAWFAGRAHLERWSIERDEGLAGATIHVDGLTGTLTDVLVRVQHLDGSTQTARLRPAEPFFVVESAPSSWQVVRTYVWLGVEHILAGIDHLLFVLALLLLVDGWRRIVGTITAFTAAHTLTLALATLGYVHVPSQPVEATIALSIVFVAAEIVHGHRGRPGLTQRWPWLVAFAFGLLHGLGFAGALAEVGLPQAAIPLALLCFNVGVELGQLLFVSAVLAVVWAAATGCQRFERRDRLTAVSRLAAAYAIGTVATYWVVARTLAFWA